MRRRTHWPRRPSCSVCTDSSGRRRRVWLGQPHVHTGFTERLRRGVTKPPAGWGAGGGFARGRASTPIRTWSARTRAPPPGALGATTDTERHHRRRGRQTSLPQHSSCRSMQRPFHLRRRRPHGSAAQPGRSVSQGYPGPACPTPSGSDPPGRSRWDLEHPLRYATTGRELTEHHRYDPTSVQLRRNQRSRSPSSVINFSETPGRRPLPRLAHRSRTGNSALSSFPRSTGV